MILIEWLEQIEQNRLFQKAHHRRVLRSEAWLQAIGHSLPNHTQARSVEEAENLAAEIKQEILYELKR